MLRDSRGDRGERGAGCATSPAPRGHSPRSQSRADGTRSERASRRARRPGLPTWRAARPARPRRLPPDTSPRPAVATPLTPSAPRLPHAAHAPLARQPRTPARRSASAPPRGVATAAAATPAAAAAPRMQKLRAGEQGGAARGPEVLRRLRLRLPTGSACWPHPAAAGAAAPSTIQNNHLTAGENRRGWEGGGRGRAEGLGRGLPPGGGGAALSTTTTPDPTAHTQSGQLHCKRGGGVRELSTPRQECDLTGARCTP